jgi:hypothetical protein
VAFPAVADPLRIRALVEVVCSQDCCCCSLLAVAFKYGHASLEDMVSGKAKITASALLPHEISASVCHDEDNEILS